MANEVEKILEGERKIMTEAPSVVAVGKKVYKIKRVSNRVRTRIDNLSKEALFWEREAKKELTLRQIRRVNNRLRSVNAKIAAYYLLGNWALFVPFLFAIKWRLLDLRLNEHVFKINNAGINDKDINFFYANFQIIKGLLVLSTKLVGDGIEQTKKREESAERMTEEDATQTSETDSKTKTDSKSPRSSKPVRLTKK
jgi:hypothetical protein